MALLQYDISVVGADNVSKALAGIEAKIRAHNSAVSRLTGVSPAAAKKLTATGATSTMRSALNSEARDKAKALREELSLKNKVNAVVVRGIQQEERLKDRSRKKDIDHAKRITRERVEFAKETVGHGASRVASTVKAVGSTGMALLGVGGAAMAASAVSQAIKLDEMSRRLSIAGRGRGEAGVDPKSMSKQFTQTGIASGLAPEDIASGVAAYTAKNGDLGAALKGQGTFATVAQGSGADVTDIFSAAADLKDKFDIQGLEDLQKAFAILSEQGKKGSFELRAMSSEFPEILATASTAGVKGIRGVRDVGSLMQIAKQASGSDSEASTAVQAMFRQLSAKSAKVQSGEAFGGGPGVSVFEGNDATKPMRNFVDVVTDVISRSKGNIPQLQEIFDARGIKAVNPLIAKYREANNAAGGGAKGDAAGREAVSKHFKQFSDVSGDFSELQRDSGDAMKSFSVQMEMANTQIKQAISDELFPELLKLVPVLKELIPYVGRAAKMFVDLVGFFMNHPFASLATIVGVQLAADFAAARLGSLASAGLEKMMSKIPGGGGGAIAPGNRIMGQTTGAGMLGAAGAGAAIGLTIGSAIIAANLVQFEKGEADMKTAGQRLNAIRDMTPEQAGEARKLVEQQRSVVNETNKPGFLESIVGRGAAQMVGAAPSETEVNTQTAFLAEMETKLAMLERAAKSMENASGNLNGAAGKTAMNVPNRGATPSPIKAY